MSDAPGPSAAPIAEPPGQRRQSLASLAGAGRFDAGIERQQIGLEGDLVDHADDVGDFLRRLFDFAHGPDRLFDHFATGLGALIRATASSLASLALLAFCLTVAAISSVEAAVSSRLDAACSVRCDRSSVPLLISVAAFSTSADAV